MSDKWRWHFSGDGSAEMFGGDPAGLAGAKPVRDLEGERAVYCRDGFFFKWYRSRCRGLAAKLRERLFPAAKQEFKAIMCLRRYGFDVVAPVAWGVCGTQSMLITREEKDCCSIRDYLHHRLSRGEEVPESFLIAWSRFLARFIASGLFFPDFHSGNVLYDEAAERFVLVDPLGLKRNLFNRSERILRMLKREFGVVLDFAPKPLLVRMLAEIEPADPEGAYRRLMEYNADYVKTRCMHRNKRLKRFRAGESTLVVNGVRVKYSSCAVPFALEGTEKFTLPPDAADELWERDYVLSLYHLPLLRVVARDEAKTPCVLYRRRTKENGGVSAADREALFERLSLTGFDRKDFDCCVDLSGTAVLRDRKFAASEQPC